MSATRAGEVRAGDVRAGDARPIGVFDSGVGGLSILRALRARLPAERFVYVADAAHAPYGERSDAFLRERSSALAKMLTEEHGAKLVVVACNTATAASIPHLRTQFADIPFVGVEPAVKPAASRTRTGRVGVMATRSTLASGKFKSLLAILPADIEFVLQPCDGLANAIELGNAARVQALCERYVGEMGPFGTSKGEIDTLVLGCTHYPFAAAQLQALVGPSVTQLEPGEPVARQAAAMLAERGVATTAKADTGTSAAEGSLLLRSTAADPSLHDSLQDFARRVLQS